MSKTEKSSFDFCAKRKIFLKVQNLAPLTVMMISDRKKGCDKREKNETQ